MLWLFIGFVCFLLVLGAFVTGNPLKFAISGVALTGAIAFVGFIGLIIWALNPHDNKSTNKNSFVPDSELVSQNTNSTADPFPFNNPDEQYSWFDRNNVTMSNRCYTSMNPPCSNLEWAKALGATLTPQQQETVNLQWCQKFANSWGQTVEQCTNTEHVK